MPVILARGFEDEWLRRDEGNVNSLRALLQPYPADDMVMYPVSPRVSSAWVDDAELLAPGRVRGGDTLVLDPRVMCAP